MFAKLHLKSQATLQRSGNGSGRGIPRLQTKNGCPVLRDMDATVVPSAVLIARVQLLNLAPVTGHVD